MELEYGVEKKGLNVYYYSLAYVTAKICSFVYPNLHIHLFPFDEFRETKNTLGKYEH